MGSKLKISSWILFLGALALVVVSPAMADKVPTTSVIGPDPPSACDAVAGNIVTNCGFEASNTAATGWTIVDASGETFVASNGFDTGANSGNNFLALGAVGADGTVSQILGTVAGQTYNISFWLASDGFLPNDFSASFNGNSLLSLTSIPAGSYTLYTFTGTATSGSTVLQFNERNDPAFLGLDDVVVTATPEPGSLALIGFGVLGLAALKLTKK